MTAPAIRRSACRVRCLSAKSADGAPLIFLPVHQPDVVPTATMPGSVRAFADNQPVTSIVNALRDLFTRQPVGTGIWTVGSFDQLTLRANATTRATARTATWGGVMPSSMSTALDCG